MKVAGATAAWDRPRGATAAVLVLGHGAGGDLNDPVLSSVGAGLAAEGIAVLRFNFPYRDAGRRAPGAQTQSEACFRAVAEEARAQGLPLYCGGKSYGGRIASHIVADGFDAGGLVFLSYPLHPPGRTKTLRDAHLRSISVPMLFVQGTRDSFAKPELLHRTIAGLETASLFEIDGGDHSLKVRATPRAELTGRIVDAVAAFIAQRAA